MELKEVNYQDIAKCKELCFAFNQLSPSKQLEQDKLLQKLLGKIGSNYSFNAPIYFDFGYNIVIGNDFYANHNLIILDGAKVTIGNHVFIGPNCTLSTANHPLDASIRNSGKEYFKPICIEDNVWLGANVTVLSGITIGKNSVIGAGSLVTKSIPEGVLAYGNPCKVIRKIEQ